MEFYFHAGVDIGTNREGDIVWSDHTRRKRGTAIAEANKMAQEHGGSPVIEWWDRDHGLHPGCCEAVAGSDYVDSLFDCGRGKSRVSKTASKQK